MIYLKNCYRVIILCIVYQLNIIWLYIYSLNKNKTLKHVLNKLILNSLVFKLF